MYEEKGAVGVVLDRKRWLKVESPTGNPDHEVRYEEMNNDGMPTSIPTVPDGPRKAQKLGLSLGVVSCRATFLSKNRLWEFATLRSN